MDMPDFFLAAGAFTVGFGAVLAALGVIAKSSILGRPLRWLWRRNVSDPVGSWHAEIVTGVIDGRVEYLMHHRNGGSSLLDLAESVNEVKSAVGLLVKHDAERDRVGMRYPDHHADSALADSVVSVQEDVTLLLDHDAERDVDGKRYSD